MAGEFELIDRFLAAWAAAAGHSVDVGRTLLLGPGDDAAIIALPPGEALVATTDTLVEGRHFPVAMPAACVGWRSLAVNLSDLAAMGAAPRAVLVALTLPDDDVAWVEACARGMGLLAGRHGAALAGGNFSRGPRALTITALGGVPPESALKRAGARVGDLVCVSGRIGLAATGLEEARRPSGVRWPDPGRDADATTALVRYALPTPRCGLGQALRGVASAALDISDGLLADLGHLATASGVAARLERAALAAVVDGPFDAAIRAGDDYELCFTVPEHRLEAARAAGRATGVPVTVIGRIVAGEGVWLDDARMQGRAGYEHF